MDIKLIYDEETDSFDIDVESSPSYEVYLKYKPYLDRHHKLLNEIDYPLSELKKMNDEERLKFFFEYEAYCKEDIDLIPYLEEFREEHNKVSKYPLTRSKMPYIVFKKLAQLYEIMGEYELAITVCDYAINAGYEYDGTKYGMQGRKDRLLKLLNKTSP